MTLTQLEYVIAVDTFGSFAEAAKRCDVTQPTLSMQIKKIEEELGVTIFDRSKKPVITTDVGQTIIAKAREGLRELNCIPELIKEKSQAHLGELRLGVIPTLCPYLLPRFSLNFAKHYPDVTLVVEELLSSQILEKLEKDMLDVGIMVTPLDMPGFVIDPLFYEIFVVYMSSHHPLTKKCSVALQDLDQQDMWLLKEGHCFRSQAITMCTEQSSMSDRPPLRFESGSLETLKRMVESQCGYTLLPELALYDLRKLQRRHVRHFKSPEPIREVSLVTHRNILKQKLITALKTEILASVPKKMRKPDRGELVRWV